MAPFAGFVGPTYTGRALAADGERSINWFPEKLETPGANPGWIMLPKPGLALFAALPNASAVQTLATLNGRCFAVAGGVLYELSSTGGNTAYGSVGSSGRVLITPGETQLLILTPTAGYVFDLTANTLSPITASGFVNGVTKAAFIDGYFLALEPNSQTFIISALNDATSWDPLDFGDAEGEPGNIVTLIADHRQLWLMGNTHSEVYYDSGDANFPFSRLEGGFMEQGCSAIDSILKLDNTIFWLGGNADGAGVVWRANGYTPQRVSTHAIEAMIQGFSRLDDATAYAYQDGGHSFYVLHFPTANATLVYDVASGFWHERAIWQNGAYQADLARTHCYCFGMHLVGDYQSGNVYQMSASVFTDNGNRIRRRRTAPDLRNGGNWTFYSELRLMTQAGMGTASGAGSDPQAMLSISNDGGFTWGAPRQASLGKMGQYYLVTKWRRLGRSRNRAFDLVIDEPIFVALIAAELEAA